MFQVYLNKFQIAVSHLFLILLSNNKFTLVNLISRNAQSPRKKLLIFVRWIKTVSEDEKSKFKRLNMLSERNVQNRSRTISLKGLFFIWNLLLKCVLLEY